MTDIAELVRQLRENDEEVPWTGPDGIMVQAADAIERLAVQRDARDRCLIAILNADERGSGQAFDDAMREAVELTGWM